MRAVRGDTCILHVIPTSGRASASLSNCTTTKEKRHRCLGQRHRLSRVFFFKALERPTPIVTVTPATVVIAAEAFVVSAQETLTVCLLVLIRIPAVTAVAAMTVPVEVRPLRVVTLTALAVIRTGVHAILITLVEGYLVVVSVVAIAAILIIPIAISIPAIVAVPIAAVRILAVRPLCLNRGASHRANTYQEKHREQGLADPAFEIM